MTTIGRTTLCSSKRMIAAGSASRTLVSSTYVRRPWELTTQTPLGTGTGPAPRQDTDVSDGPGLAPRRAAPALLSVRQHATREARRSEGPSRERRRAVHHYRRYPRTRVGKSTARLLAGVSPGNPALRRLRRRIAGCGPRRSEVPA